MNRDHCIDENSMFFNGGVDTVVDTKVDVPQPLNFVCVFSKYVLVSKHV